MKDDLTILPPPAPNQTFHATKTRRVRTADKRKTRPKKGLTQFNVKVTPSVKERLETAFDDVSSSMTKGEFMGLLIAAYEAQQGNTDIADVVAKWRQPNRPAKEDIKDGRTVPLGIYATPDLARVLNNRAHTKRWTLGATVEHACAIAVEAEREVGENPDAQFSNS